jgi:hypothetical protein
VLVLERATSHSITVRPATLRLGGGENSVSCIIITAKAVLALERAGTDIITVRSRARSFGRRRKLSEPYIITVKAVLALRGCNHLSLSDHNPFGGGEEVVFLLFSVPPSL